jgi:hypothetical protein
MKKLFFVLAVVLLLWSATVQANQAATVIMEGEDVLQTVDGTIYVGQGVAINGDWITIFNVRFPVMEDNKIVGAATFPAVNVKIVYHKGKINAVQPAPKQQGKPDTEAFNSW